MDELETTRLHLRPLASVDESTAVAFFHALYSLPEALRFMPYTAHRTVAETERWFGRVHAGAGIYWLVFEKESHQPVGAINYLGGTRFPGMGYIFHPDYWGKGYATEACRATLGYGFEALGYDRVELWIDERHAASSRVAEKLGFRVKGRLAQRYAHEETHHFMLVWGLLASEWGNAVGDGATRPCLFRAEPVLLVHDVVQTAEFYRDKLGFQIDFFHGEPPDHAGVSYAEWSGQGVVLQLSQVPRHQPLDQPTGYLYIIMDTGLDALYAQYADRGVKIAYAPVDRPWGLREFEIEDLNGYRLRFGTHL